jgi:hypothetical protein
LVDILKEDVHNWKNTPGHLSEEFPSLAPVKRPRQGIPPIESLKITGNQEFWCNTIRQVFSFPSREREFDSRRQLNVRFKFGPGKLVNGG